MADDKRLYEGIVLLSQQAGELPEAMAHVRELLDRAEADVVGLIKWAERKLEYQISGQRRGTYLLTYFYATPTKIAALDRDCNLSDSVLRSMFLRVEHIGEVELNEFREKAAVVGDGEKEGGEQEGGEQEGGEKDAKAEKPASKDSKEDEKAESAEAKSAEGEKKGESGEGGEGEPVAAGSEEKSD